MNFKRLFRLLTCLILVCCLLVNISPIKAQASAILASPYIIPVGIAVLTALIGIGIMESDTDLTRIDSLVETISDQGVISGYTVDGGIQLWNLENEASLRMDVNFITAIIDYLFGTGYIWDVDAYYPGTQVYKVNWDANYKTICGYTYHYLFYNPTKKIYQAIGSEEEILSSAQTDGTTYYYLASGNQMRFAASNDNNLSYATGIYAGSNWTVFPAGNDFIAEPGVMSWMDVTLGDVAQSDEPFDQGYPLWYTGATVIPDEDIVTVPVGILPTDTYEDVKVKDQEIIWGIVIEDTGTGGGSTDPTEPEDPIYGDVVTATFLERLFGGVSTKFDEIKISIEEIPSQFREFFSDLKTGIEELPSKFADWFNNIQTALEELPAKFEKWFTDISNWLSKLWEILCDIPQAILEGLELIFMKLFAPSSDYFETKVNSLKAKYTFLEPMLATGTDLKLFFQNIGSKPPIIYIDLGAATSYYPMGGKTVFLDLTWYSQYKPTMDAILGGFIWLWLAWRVWLSIPGILQGTSGMWGSPNMHPDGMFNALPRLGSGAEVKQLGTSEYHSRGTEGKHYTKHEGS